MKQDATKREILAYMKGMIGLAITDHGRKSHKKVMACINEWMPYLMDEPIQRKKRKRKPTQRQLELKRIKEEGGIVGVEVK